MKTIINSTITLQQPAKVFELKTLSDFHQTQDNPKEKILLVILAEANPPQQIVVKGSEYDAVGQWTDSSLNDYLISKLGLQIK